MSIKDKISKNLERLSQEITAYKTEIRDVIKPGIKGARQEAIEDGENPLLHSLHKRSAYIEEWYDKMPRVNAYLFWTRLVFIWPPVVYMLWTSWGGGA
tara:strand:- start:353 stop:646 length:294 start_codon:yes stop_codon:yes gene_type:complete